MVINRQTSVKIHCLKICFHLHCSLSIQNDMIIFFIRGWSKVRHKSKRPIPPPPPPPKCDNVRLMSLIACVSIGAFQRRKGIIL